MQGSMEGSSLALVRIHISTVFSHKPSNCACFLGRGKFIPLKKVPMTGTFNCFIVKEDGREIPVDANISPEDCSPSKSELRKIITPGKIEVVHRYDEEPKPWKCIVPQCTAEFPTRDEYNDHVSMGCCQVTLRSESQMGTIKRQFFNRFGMDNTEGYTSQKALRKIITHMEPFRNVSIPHGMRRKKPAFKEPHGQGYALMKKGANARFDKDVESFMEDLVLEGEQLGKPYKALEAMHLMRTARLPSGEKRFHSSSWLKEDQIKGLFSRLAKKMKRKSLQTEAESDQEEPTEELEQEIVVGQAEVQAKILAEFEMDEQQSLIIDWHPIQVPMFELSALNNRLECFIDFQANGFELCPLARDFLSKHGKKNSQIFGLAKTDLKDIVVTCGLPIPKGKSYSAYANTIVDFVKTTCPDECLSLVS